MNTHEKLKQIIILYDQGYSITKLKNMFHISDTTIYSNYKIHLDRKYKRYLFFHDLPC